LAGRWGREYSLRNVSKMAGRRPVSSPDCRGHDRTGLWASGLAVRVKAFGVWGLGFRL